MGHDDARNDSAAERRGVLFWRNPPQDAQGARGPHQLLVGRYRHRAVDARRTSRRPLDASEFRQVEPSAGRPHRALERHGVGPRAVRHQGRDLVPGLPQHARRRRLYRQDRVARARLGGRATSRTSSYSSRPTSTTTRKTPLSPSCRRRRHASRRRCRTAATP